MFAYNDVEGPPFTPRLSDAARDDLQCNVLYSTERIRSKQLFVRFEAAELLAGWLRSTPPVTSEQQRGASHQDVNLLFTYTGLRKLGVPVSHLAAMDEAFQRGARSDHTLRKLRDPAPVSWKGHEEGWDAALLVHADTEVPLALPNAACVIENGNSLDAHGKVITSRAAAARRFNVYGYVDGISVNYYEGDVSEFQHYDPRRRLSTLLASDPCVESARRFGSYFVFRKYEQDVAAFEKKVEAIAEAIEQREKAPGSRVMLADRFPAFRKVSGARLRTLVKAWIMGRHTNGDTVMGEAGNDFTYDADPNGVRCPFHAHVAKVNPRGRTGNLEFEHACSLARRGISYGDRASAEKGLLFWCAQSSIVRQFEQLQQQWANDDQVDVTLRPTPDLDNVIGKRADPVPFETVTDQYPPIPRYDRWKGTIDIDFGIYDTIRLKGAEYFFAPSLSGIAALKGRP